MQLEMGIIKLEVKLPELNKAVEEFKRNRLKSFEAIAAEVKTVVSNTINQLLQGARCFDQKANSGRSLQRSRRHLTWILAFSLATSG